jgi:hypothetical protein
MPGLDQTGPEGRGAMSGRRMGRCTNYGAAARKKGSDKKEPEEDNLSRGRGGRGSGAGRGSGGRGRGGRGGGGRHGGGAGRQNR